jgi:Ca2+-binding RTX toxin-like protein
MPLTTASNLFTDNFSGSELSTDLWQPLAKGHEYKGRTWTPSDTRPYTQGGGFPTVSNNTARFALNTWDGDPNKPVDKHAFLGTEAITKAAWNPLTGGLAFQGKFKFSGDGTGNAAALQQGGMIIGFFSYEKNAPPNDFHTEIDYEVFTSNLKNPEKNQISTNIFNGERNLTIHDPVHNTDVTIPYDPLSYPNNNPLPNAGYHTYRFEWFPSWISFYIDGKLLREVTNKASLPDPAKDQRLHLNLWGQSTNVGYAYGDWTGNPVGDPALGPATTAAAGKTFYADFQKVSVDRLSSRLGTANADTLVGSAGGDGIDGGAGNDTLTGGDGNDTIMGGSGNDTIDAGAGGDRILGLRGRDTINGGIGNDTLVLIDDMSNGFVFRSNTIAGIETIELQAGHSFALTLDDGNVAAGSHLTVNGQALEAGNFLHFDGSAETNARLLLFGGAGDDELRGGAMNDRIAGGDGADKLVGGAGRDVLVGGLGGDFLYGGADNDRFVFNDVAESTETSSDWIRGWNVGDRIDLSAIDAHAFGPFDQAFIYIGAADFSSGGGQLQVRTTDSGNTIIRGDTDGDLRADLTIKLAGTPGLGASSFVL